jgi:hypothetical protein
MPGLLLHQNAAMQCFHLAPVTVVPGQARVTASAMLVAVSTGQLTVAGCLFQVPAPSGTKPQPCVKVQWVNLSARIKIMGQPVLLQPTPSGTGAGVCQSVEQIPQGAPIVNTMQPRVLGT